MKALAEAIVISVLIICITSCVIVESHNDTKTKIELERIKHINNK